MTVSSKLKKLLPHLKGAGPAIGGAGLGAGTTHYLAKERLRKQKRDDDRRSRRQVKHFIKALENIEKKATSSKNYTYQEGQWDTFGQAGLAGPGPGMTDFKRDIKKFISRADPKDELTNTVATNDWEQLMEEKKAGTMLSDKIANITGSMNSKKKLDDGALDQKKAKKQGGVGTGKQDLFDTKGPQVTINDKPSAAGLGITNTNKPQNYDESKPIESKADPKDKYKSGALMGKEGMAKLSALAGKILKGVAVAGGGAAAGAYGMKKKKEGERTKELGKIKVMNQMENRHIRRNMSRMFKKYNDKENKALAKHFYSAGKRESGGSK